MNRAYAFAGNFWRYQARRFPIVALVLVFLPPILSSGAVVIAAAPAGFVATALLASIACMLHLRIIDDFRDDAHDAAHHPERPLVAGAITRRELAMTDRVAVATLIVCALTANAQAVAIASFMLVFSFFAGRDFFLGERLRRHFFAYNALNMLQMGFLQILVYHLASADVRPTGLVLLHFLFTGTGSVIVEILRKLKIPGDDGTGRDTYTWHLGFRGTLWVYSALAVANILFFLLLARGIALPFWTIIAAAAGAVTAASVLYNDRCRRSLSNQIMRGCFLVTYGGLNIAIYLGAST